MMPSTRRSSRMRNKPNRYTPPDEDRQQKITAKGQTNEKSGGFSVEEPTDYLPYVPEDDDPPLGPIDMTSAGIAPEPDDDGFYFVEEIEGRRFCPSKNQWLFHCSFKGYPRSQNMWLPFSYLNSWCQNYIIERFTHSGRAAKLPTPTEEQQRAVNDALLESRKRTEKRNEENKYKEDPDSESETPGPVSGYHDGPYVPSIADDEDSLGGSLSEMSSIFPEYTLANDSVLQPNEDAFNCTSDVARHSAPTSISPSAPAFPPPTANASTPFRMLPPQSVGRGKTIKRQRRASVSPSPKQSKNTKRKRLVSSSRGKTKTRDGALPRKSSRDKLFTNNEHFAERCNLFAKLLLNAQVPLTKKQGSRIFTLITELEKVIHEAEDLVDSADTHEYHSVTVMSTKNFDGRSTSFGAARKALFSEPHTNVALYDGKEGGEGQRMSDNSDVVSSSEKEDIELDASVDVDCDEGEALKSGSFPVRSSFLSGKGFHQSKNFPRQVRDGETYGTELFHELERKNPDTEVLKGDMNVIGSVKIIDAVNNVKYQRRVSLIEETPCIADSRDQDSMDNPDDIDDCEGCDEDGYATQDEYSGSGNYVSNVDLSSASSNAGSGSFCAF
jgi:hypothetical protein